MLLPQRVSVVGGPGAGKTHLAARLSERLDVPHIEIDALYHQPGWTPLPTDVFRERIDRLVAAPAWVADGNYRVVRDLVWGRADTVVWLDYPRPRVMASLLRRTLGRALLRRELWNGNREQWRDVLRLWQPERSILAWAWTRHRAYIERYEAAMADPAYPHLEFVRLRSRAQAQRWLDALVPSASGSNGPPPQGESGP